MHFTEKQWAPYPCLGNRITGSRLGVMYGGPVYHVPFGDAAAVEKQLEVCEKIGIGVAGVIMEPIQGEAGAIVPPDDFWPRIREATKQYRTMLIADEVQTGLGRTGKLWGVDHWNVVPDILAVAKSLGGGVMPVMRILLHRGNLAVHDVSKSIHPHDHDGRWRPGLFCSHCSD